LNEEDMSFLIPEQGADESIAGRTIDPELPFAFALDENGDVVVTEVASEMFEPGDEAAWNEVLSDAPPPLPAQSRRRHAARHARPALNSARRSLLGATLTGLVLGAVAVLCLFVGSVATMALVAVAVTVAAGELFAVLQRVSYRPATLVGLVTVPAMVIAAYLHGPVGIVGVVAAAFLAIGAWFLTSRSGDEPVVNLAVTLLVIGWVGGCGALAGMLLAPAAHPHGHGVTLIGGIILIVVANDVGAYLVGSRFGRHPLAVSISPGKTVEGFIGGAVLSIAVALGAVSQVFPMSLTRAGILGVVVALIAPCGDLLESRVKRDLGVKDMSSLLPNHGGLFDRIDAMLFVLPAAYLVFAIGHVS
jgi:phosphatidate cytidylyltransferase